MFFLLQFLTNKCEYFILHLAYFKIQPIFVDLYNISNIWGHILGQKNLDLVMT